MCDLAQRTAAHRIHQHLEGIAVVDDRAPQALEQLRRLARMAFVEGSEALQLRLLLRIGGARQLHRRRRGAAVRIAEGVDADDGIGAIVLLPFVVQRLLLDLAALIAGFHGAEHAAAVGDGIEFLEHRFLDQIGQFVDDEAALVRVLVLGQAPFAVDDELNRHGAAHALLGGRGDGLVVGIGVQAVAIVVDGAQSLQRRAYVVEGHLLRVQGTAGSLHMVLELLAALVRTVFILHGHGPDAARDAADHRVFRIHAVREEERQIRGKVVDVHAAREIRLDVGEAVGEGERELGDGIRAGFGDVIAGNRDRVEILHLVVHEVFLDVAHHLQRELGGKDAGILALVFLQYVRLHGAAHRRQRPCPDLLVFVRGRIAAVLLLELHHLLIDGGVHEHGQNHRRRPVDGHGHRGGRRAQVESRVQHLHVVERRDGYAGIAHLAVDIRAQIRIPAVEGHRIEGRGQAVRGHALGHPLEALIGAERIAFAGEHARRVLAFALECEHAGRVRIGARNVFLQQEAQHLALVLEARQRHLADLAARQRFVRELGADLLVADLHDILGLRVQLLRFRPLFQQLGRRRVEFRAFRRDQLAETGNRPPRRREQGLGGGERLALTCDPRLAPDEPVELAQRFGNLRQIAHPLRRHDGAAARGSLYRGARQLARAELESLVRQARQHGLVERRDAVVVEARGHGAVHGHVVRTLRERFMVALVLLAHVAQRIFGTLAVEFVDGDEVGKIEHVDFLELRGRAEFRRHDVDRSADQGNDRGFSLAYAGGLHHDQIESADLAGSQHFGQRGGDFRARVAGGHRAHENLVGLDRIHSNAVAQECAAGALA